MATTLHKRDLPETFAGKIDSWILTADSGLYEFTQIISFDENTSTPVIRIDISETDEIRDYIDSCNKLYISTISKRLDNKILQENIRNVDLVISKANSFITELENSKI